ncbi:MAG TPA: hypothetical protein VK186_09815, partial [Candidatus Deferrimicrobium sp.]|nr:hypothetical protein [Candidatus Deferrimicrobium sp.]
YEPQDELMRLILRQLEKAAGDNKLLEQLEMEELADLELENAFGDMKRQLLQKDKVIEEKEKALEQQNKAVEEKEKALEQKDQVIEENKKALEQKNKAIEEKEKLIQELLSQLKNR